MKPLLPLLAALLLGVSSTPPARATDAELARKALAVLKKHCYTCHGRDLEAGLDVTDHKAMLDKRFVVPGDLEASKVWRRVGIRDNMPPRDVAERPTEADKAVLKAWIEGAAPAFPPDLAARPYLGEKEILLAVRQDLEAAEAADRRFLRYFTLANLHNNPQISDAELRACRAALSKVVNSLSWEARLVIPEPVGGDHVTAAVFKVDLRHLGWQREGLWGEVLRVYPYGVSHDNDPDPELRAAAQEVCRLTGSDLPYVRADWFVTTAARPPLYHTLLYDEKLPALRDRAADPQDARNPKKMKATDLEEFLQVNVIENFRTDRLARGGFARSGVSAQNRLVERHAAAFGAYWKSYDFKPANARSSLLQFPLGPAFPGNEFARQAFDHDGGEIIFHLPNGLQGYLLVDAQDNRIDVGPADVVGDANKALRTTEIVNGLSCMVCHNAGMKPFTDQVRGGFRTAGPARQKVDRLYPEPSRMEELVREDADLFLKAAARATQVFLQPGGGDLDVTELDEPVRVMAQRYLADLDAAAVACELDLHTVDPATGAKQLGVARLQAAVSVDRRLQRLGLGVLAQPGGLIKRGDWELVQGISMFHQAAGAFNKAANRPLK